MDLEGPFSANCGFLLTGHNRVVLGHPISMSFLRVDGWSTDPRVLGRHTMSQLVSMASMFSNI